MGVGINEGGGKMTEKVIEGRSGQQFKKMKSQNETILNYTMCVLSVDS